MHLLSPALVLAASDIRLFSAATPTWTDKEVLGAIGSVVATILGVGVPIMLYLLRKAESKSKVRMHFGEAQKQKLLQNIIQLQGKNQSLEKTSAQRNQRLSILESFATKALTKNKALLEIKKRLEKEIDDRRQQLEHHEKELNSLQIQLDGVCGDLKIQNRRIEKALTKDGRTWTERVLASAPAFAVLEPGGRRTPIVAVLNLKGGVGKTTITANLGAALDGLGYRVLLLDLDLQGSLTSLYVPEEKQAELYERSCLLGDYYTAVMDDSASNILEFTQPILEKKKSGLVPTTDQLTYAEMNLTIRWLLREEGLCDPRFMLRRELHRDRICQRFDLVLLDCPPFINVSCVNALAACDYVMIPIMPSKPATDRVPILLERLKEFRENINSHLNILGIVANRTYREELTMDEKNRLTALKEHCKDIWGSDILQFKTNVRQNVDLRNAEDNHRPLRKEDGMYQVFQQLAKEVQIRLPTYCKSALNNRDQALEARS